MKEIQTKVADDAVNFTKLHSINEFRARLRYLMEKDTKGGGTPAGTKSRAIAVRENRLDSRDIFIGTREVIIAHGEELYRLRLTAQNKLILTK